MYGKSGSLGRNDAERLLRLLVVEGLLAEDLSTGADSQIIAHAKLGPRAMEFINQKFQVSHLIIITK